MNPLANLQPVNLAGTTQNALLQGLQVGDAMRQRKQQEMQQTAMDNAYRGAMAGDKNAFNALANVPGMAQKAYGLQQGQAQAQAQQEEADRMRLAKVADLLDNSTDETSYQRNLGVARQLGLDVSTAPPTFDPNFIQTQTAIAKAVLGNDPELPLIGQEVMLRGFKPGTPEFQAEIGRILTAKYETVKTVPYGEQGGVVAYDAYTKTQTPLVVPGYPTGQAGPSAQIPSPAIEALKANPQRAAEFDAKFGTGAAQRILGGGVGNNVGGF